MLDCDDVASAEKPEVFGEIPFSLGYVQISQLPLSPANAGPRFFCFMPFFVCVRSSRRNGPPYLWIREHKMKKWGRAHKRELCERFNPTRSDRFEILTNIKSLDPGFRRGERERGGIL
jgi:hypothetical protein